MRSDTGIRDQIPDAVTEDAPNGVRLELASGTEIESLVPAYRRDGELAEQTVPAAAERHGEFK